MKLEEAKKVLARAFARELQRHHGRIGTVENALGHSNGHFKRLMREKSGISMDLIIQALVLLEVEPGEFFAKAYDIGLTAEHLLGLDGRSGKIDPALGRMRKAVLRLESGSLTVGTGRKARDFSKRLETLSRAGISYQRKYLRRTRTFRQIAFVTAYLERLDSLRYSRPKDTAKLAETVAVDLLPETAGAKGDLMGLMCKTVGVFGSAKRQAADFDTAREAIGFGLRLAGRHGLEVSRAELLQRGAYVLSDNSEFDRALLLLQEAFTIYFDAKLQAGMGKILVGRAIMLSNKGDHLRSIQVFESALDYLSKEDPRVDRWRLAAYNGITIGYRELGMLDVAQRWLQQAVDGLGDFGDSISAKLAWQVGVIAYGRGDNPRAEQYLQRSYDVLGITDNAITAALVSLDLAACLVSQGKTEEASRLAKDTTRLLTQFQHNKYAQAALMRFIRADLGGQLTTELIEKVSEELRNGAPETECALIQPIWP